MSKGLDSATRGGSGVGADGNASCESRALGLLEVLRDDAVVSASFVDFCGRLSDGGLPWFCSGCDVVALKSGDSICLPFARCAGGSCAVPYRCAFVP